MLWLQTAPIPLFHLHPFLFAAFWLTSTDLSLELHKWKTKLRLSFNVVSLFLAKRHGGPVNGWSVNFAYTNLEFTRIDLMPELSALIPYFTLFAGTFLAVLAIVPIASAIARLVGLVDAPDARRKFHSNAVPLVGGVSVFLGMVIACSIVFLFFPNEIFGNQLTSSKVIQVVGLLVAATIIVVIGVIDDRFGIRGRQKLLGQIFVSLIVIGTGTWVFSFRVSDKTFDLRDAWTRTSQPQVSALHEVIDSDANAKLLEIERQTKAGEVRVSEADRQNEAVARRSKVLKANVARSYPAITVLYRGLALLAGAFTVFWIVGAINSVNLIDGADGLAGTTTFIISAVARHHCDLHR